MRLFMNSIGARGEIRTRRLLILDQQGIPIPFTRASIGVADQTLTG